MANFVETTQPYWIFLSNMNIDGSYTYHISLKIDEYDVEPVVVIFLRRFYGDIASVLMDACMIIVTSHLCKKLI